MDKRRYGATRMKGEEGNVVRVEVERVQVVGWIWNEGPPKLKGANELPLICSRS
jgi:hypothetical protein